MPSLKRKEKKPTESPDNSFTHVQSTEVASEPAALTGDAAQVYARLELALRKQIEVLQSEHLQFHCIEDVFIV